MYLCDQVNVCKTKALTNMRASGSDDAIKLVPPLELNLDIAVEYIQVGACGMLCLPRRCVLVLCFCCQYMLARTNSHIAAYCFGRLFSFSPSPVALPVC
jgi:hypothetical protein